jgi:hypothetical protein
MKRKRRNVEEFEYPVRAKNPILDIFLFRLVFKPWSILWLFHISMALLLTTGLVMNLIGPRVLFHTSEYSLLRQFHGYVGAIFTIMFILYLGIIVMNKNFRALRETINYIESVFYAGFIVSGFSFSTIFNPGNILPFLAPYATLVHTLLLTYGWVAASFVGGGGMVQGVASIYFLIERARSRHRIRSEVQREGRKRDG